MFIAHKTPILKSIEFLNNSRNNTTENGIPTKSVISVCKTILFITFDIKINTMQVYAQKNGLKEGDTSSF